MTTQDGIPTGFAPPSLPAAIELLTAMNQGGSQDPAFFWAAVHRVMADGTDAEDPGAALADLVFGLTSLSQIMLHHFAQSTGATEEFIVNRIATLYCGQTTG